MAFWNKKKIEVKEEVKPVEERSSIFDANPFGTGYAFGSGTYNPSNALMLSAVYRAVNLISNGIASLQMKVYDINPQGFKSESLNNTLSNLLGCEPNEFMGRYIFFKELEQYKLMRGNAYVYITRDKKFNPTKLELINPDFVVPLILNGQLKYQLTNLNITADASDVIHIMNYPYTDSLNITRGVSTIQYAANSLSVSYYSEKQADNFFKGGANNVGILSTTAALKPEQKEQIINSLKSSSSMDGNSPAGVSLIGGADLKFTPFNISPKDAQLLEARQFNVIDIARFFNVSPILLFDLQNTKVSSAENSQLDFLNTTLLSEIELLENEFTRKLLLPSQRNRMELRFDFSNILRADNQSRAGYYQTLSQIGVMSPNDIAKELNLPEVKGGDVHTIPVNVMDIENIIYNQPKTLAEAPIDNKTKI
jgi:HK97 family phage portal protein